jgi:epoxyqueuosine reductase
VANSSRHKQFEEVLQIRLEKSIKQFVATSPLNRFEALNEGRIFGKPLIGFANGDDAIFEKYKEIIGDFHLTPRKALEISLESRGGNRKRIEQVRVISFILPVSYKTRLSMRKESVVPSLRWNHTRWRGQDFIYELSRYLVSLLESLGYLAVAPELMDLYKFTNLPSGIVSNWSQRHIAYAAGLGTFSLNDGFITSRGMAMRCGSVVTNAAIKPSPRIYKDHLANCLFYSERSCKRCAERCPAGAISNEGHDKNKCREFLLTRQKEIIKELGREDGYIGRYLGCGLCQTNVPCESRIPVRALK